MRDANVGSITPDCCPQHSCPVCGGCLFFPCKVTANGVHPERDDGSSR